MWFRTTKKAQTTSFLKANALGTIFPAVSTPYLIPIPLPRFTNTKRQGYFLDKGTER